MFLLVLRELIVIAVGLAIAYALYKVLVKTKRRENIDAAKDNIKMTLDEAESIPKVKDVAEALNKIKQFLTEGKKNA